MTKKLKTLILSQLTQGIDSRSLAMSCGFAFVLGTFPILGTTTLLLALAGLAFHLNQPITQAMNYILTPIHVLLIPVYLKAGEFALNASPVSIHPQEMFDLLKNDFPLFLSLYGAATLHAILAWAVLAPPIGVLIFLLSRPMFDKLHTSHKNGQS